MCTAAPCCSAAVSYTHLDVRGPAQLGDYYLNRSGMVDMPEEWKGGIDTAQFGRYVAQQEQGVFTEYGYLCLLYTSRCV